MTLRIYSHEFLQAISDQARSSERGRQHRNLHSSYNDPCQQFFNAVGINSYIRPHRHLLDPKSETLIAIKGLFALITFSDSGDIDSIVRFASEKYCLDAGNVGAEISPGVWHTVVALSDQAVMLEFKAGPFDETVAKELASWAPAEGSSNSTTYLSMLKRQAAFAIPLPSIV